MATFYQSAFGMQEVQRIQTPQFLEVMLDFGATVEAAKANANGDLVIMQRASDDVNDDLPHVVFNVTDMAATVKAIKAAGGKMESEPSEFGKTGILIGMGIDPAGNHFEMIQQPKQLPGAARARLGCRLLPADTRSRPSCAVLATSRPSRA